MSARRRTPIAGLPTLGQCWTCSVRIARDCPSDRFPCLMRTRPAEMCRVDSLLNCRLFSDVAHGLRESELRNSFLAQSHLVFCGLADASCERCCQARAGAKQSSAWLRWRQAGAQATAAPSFSGRKPALRPNGRKGAGRRRSRAARLSMQLLPGTRKSDIQHLVAHAALHRDAFGPLRKEIVAIDECKREIE